MVTVREWLDEAGFVWSNGVIIFHTTEGKYPGWERGQQALKFDLRKSPLPIPELEEMLDREFDCGYGGPESPRFVADDGLCIYFPSQYDGNTVIEWIHKNIGEYMNTDNETPYPGG